MSSNKLSVILVLLILLTVSACSNNSTIEYPSNQNDKTTSYPVDSGYPTENQETSYPVDYDTNNSYHKGPDFNISRPVVAGDMTVSGTGPENVPLLLIDVSEVDLVISENND